MISKAPERLAAIIDRNRRPHPAHCFEELEGALQRHVASASGLPVRCVSPSTGFIEDLGLDMLGSLELVLSLEALLKIQLPDREAAQVNCIRDFLDSLSNTAFKLGQSCACPKYEDRLSDTSFAQHRGQATEINSLWPIGNDLRVRSTRPF